MLASVRKKLFKIQWRLYISVFFITILIAVIINIMLGDEKVSMALVAVGTLLLAFATAYAIDNSRQQEKRRLEGEQQKRQEDRDLDFKRRKLDWIVNWAREVTRELLFPIPRHEGIDPDNLKQRLQNYVGQWIVTDTAKILGAEFEKIVEKAEKDILAYIKELEKPAPDHKQYIKGLNQSLGNVQKGALKVESDLVKQSPPRGTGTK